MVGREYHKKISMNKGKRRCVKGCQGSGKFFKFPDAEGDKERHDCWLQRLGVTGSTPKFLYACEKHFDPMLHVGGRLARDAIPEVWSDYKSYVKQKLNQNIAESNLSSWPGNGKKTFNNLEERVMKLCGLEAHTMPLTTPGAQSLSVNNSLARESNATNNSPTPVGRSFGVYNKACEAAISRDKLDYKQTVPDNMPITSKETDAGSRSETDKTTKRALFEEQINIQQQFDSIEISNRNEQNVDEIATGFNILCKANETLIKTQKEMLLEMRRHNMVMENFKQEEINLSILMGFDRI